MSSSVSGLAAKLTFRARAPATRCTETARVARERLEGVLDELKGAEA